MMIVASNSSHLEWALALVTGVVALPVRAAEYDLADGKLSVIGSVFAGTALRSAERDPKLLPNVNSSVIGIAGDAVSASAGRNQDDGNLNFDRGDPISTALRAYLALGYRLGDYGASLSAKAWYDAALEQRGHAWGHNPTFYADGAALSDAGALPWSRFAGAVFDSANVYGHQQFDAVALDWTLGYQKLEWGNQYAIVGGLRDLTPFDAPSATRPGLRRELEREARIGIPLIFARIGLPQDTSVEMFYQFAFTPNAPQQCGTFYSSLEFIARGCNRVMLGNFSDKQSMVNGWYLQRAADMETSNAGQMGAALKHRVESWATDFGLYAAQYHSRGAFLGVYKSTRDVPFVPDNADGLNGEYFSEFPEKIRMFGASFETRLQGLRLLGEIVYRPNQPMGYSGGDLLPAFSSNNAPTPLRAQASATAPGAAFAGYERHKALQIQLAASSQFPQVLGAAAMDVGGEIVYKGVPDLPDVTVTRFGRSDVFGQGPVNGACPADNPVSCSTDGYVSRHAIGYRLRASLNYRKVTESMDLLPSVSFGQDLSGWSADASIMQGRYLAVVALRANFVGGFAGEIVWLPTGGGTYNTMRDRSAIQASVGYSFRCIDAANRPQQQACARRVGARTRGCSVWPTPPQCSKRHSPTA